LKESKANIKTKEETILSLTNQLSNLGNKSNQGEQSTKMEITRLNDEVDRLSIALSDAKSRSKEYADSISLLELAANKSKVEWQFR
jgi:hypothetical protein